jgi:hypothetical protein
MTIAAQSNTGPACPRCKAELGHALQNGDITCPSCHKSFEATVFTPPERKLHVVEVASAGPDGSTPCANHPRNAATTNCKRCGLLICALCDMNIATGSFCPACFERVRAEGVPDAGARRYVDYASLARLCATLGFAASFFFLGLPLGAVALYLATRGLKQRRQEGRSRAGMVVVIILSIVDMLLSAAMIGFLIWSLFQTKR